MYGFIYLTVNKINNKKYIGMCKNTHRENYLGSGTLLKKAIKKYGRENFERVILQECESFHELSDAEKYWIKEYNAVNDVDFYNLTDGGFGGNSDYLKEYWNNFTEQERKMCRKWHKKDMSDKNNPMFGKKHSEETKKKIGLKSVNRNWKKPNHHGENNPRAKKAIVIYNNIEKQYDCLKKFSDETGIPYSTVKTIARKNLYSKRYNLKITYANF